MYRYEKYYCKRFSHCNALVKEGVVDNPNAVAFEEAGFAYDGKSFVFRHINLKIKEGEFVCIIGGNGSGKTTFAKLINALLLPSEGNVFVGSDNTGDENLTYLIRSRVGFVFQNPDDQLVSNLIENEVAFGPENLGVEENQIRIRIKKALLSAGLSDINQTEVSALSGGQKQRLAIAGVLAINPTVLILDESTAMLDARGKDNLMHTINNLHAQGMTVVMITHYMEEAAQAERVIVLENGEICLDGTPDQVLTCTEKLHSLHLLPPFAVRMSYALQAQGIPVKTSITTDKLEENLCTLLLNR